MSLAPFKHCIYKATHTSRLNSFNSSAVTPFGSSVADLMRETDDTSPSGSFRYVSKRRDPISINQ